MLIISNIRTAFCERCNLLLSRTPSSTAENPIFFCNKPHLLLRRTPLPPFSPSFFDGFPLFSCWVLALILRSIRLVWGEVEQKFSFSFLRFQEQLFRLFLFLPLNYMFLPSLRVLPNPTHPCSIHRVRTSLCVVSTLYVADYLNFRMIHRKAAFLHVGSLAYGYLGRCMFLRRALSPLVGSDFFIIVRIFLCPATHVLVDFKSVGPLLVFVFCD